MKYTESKDEEWRERLEMGRHHRQGYLEFEAGPVRLAPSQADLPN